jgi:hypothetical protein
MDEIKEIKETNNEIENTLEEITSLVEDGTVKKEELGKKDREEKQIEFKLDNLNLSKSSR